ncbi:MAG: hypothetical protein H6835_11735 [Planctomycetes bacterium]|nr:hypothetical protein [Planctomycetota bacterium]
MTKPRVCVLAGPNGAGKTTVARPLVRDELGIRTFVNADVIAQGLAGFDASAKAVAAGRLMLAQLQQLATDRADFAFETTLSARSFLPWLIRRRYQRGIDNFARRYRQQVDRWWCYDNSEAVTRLVAFGGGDSLSVGEPMIWKQILQ